MIGFDVTNQSRSRHASGLLRVSRRLLDELRRLVPDRVVPVTWDRRLNRPRRLDGTGWRAGPDDWWLTPELFSDRERPGLSAWLRSGACRTAAIFNDAIPLKFPHTTWARSVARHPEYLKMLGSFTRVWAISDASAAELAGWWKWIGLREHPPIEVLALGADFDEGPRTVDPDSPIPGPVLIQVGILEPRKNQSLTVRLARRLLAEAVAFELHFIGRMNPEFGRPVAAEVRALMAGHSGVHWHRGLNDVQMRELYTRTRVALFPSRAEGCGLPPLEALWKGVPSVVADLPVLREASGPGIVFAGLEDLDSWVGEVRRLLTDDEAWSARRGEIIRRPLPTWADTAAALVGGMEAVPRVAGESGSG